MAGFEDDDFSLSGLTQERHELNVTVISSSSDVDNYDGILDCAQKLAGEISDKTSNFTGRGRQARCRARWCRARSIKFPDF